MTRLQSLLLKQSELRTELAGLLDIEKRSEEQEGRRVKVSRELRGMESEIRDARLVEPEVVETETRNEGDAETRERLKLRSEFKIANLIAAGIQGRRVSGREAEYAAAVGAAAGQIPIDVYEPERRSDTPALETRAVSPGPDTAGTVQRPIVPAIFDRSIAPFLGVEMPSAGVGDQAFPVLSSSLTAEPKAKDAAAPETAAGFTVTSVQPRRITGSFRVRYEDLARLADMEGALRRNLQDAVTDGVDNQILNGSASGDGTIHGLLAQLTDPSAPASGVDTWARYHTALTSHIDGLFAVDESGVSALVGPQTYRGMAAQFRADESNESFSAYWRRVGGGLRASRRIAAPATNIQQAVIVRSNPAMDASAVMAHWGAFDLTIRDVYSEAGKGQVIVTAVALVSDVVILRPGVYVQDSFRLA